MTCVDRHGVAKTTLSDVAAVAGITRKTLYRYFPNMEALLYETGAVAAAEFVQRLVVHASKWIEPADVLAEAVCFAIEQLPKEPYAGLLIAGGRPDDADVAARLILEPAVATFAAMSAASASGNGQAAT